jgi:hypothetical protein
LRTANSLSASVWRPVDVRKSVAAVLGPSSDFSDVHSRGIRVLVFTIAWVGSRRAVIGRKERSLSLLVIDHLERRALANVARTGPDRSCVDRGDKAL